MRAKKKKQILEMDPDLPSPDGKPGRPAGSGLPTLHGENRSGPDAAARRLTRRVGRPSNEDLAPVELPFESSLAFQLRNVGGRKPAIEYARFGASVDVRLQKFIYAHDALSVSDREAIRLEDLCAAAEMSPPEFFGAIATVACRLGMDASRFIVGVNHQEIVQAAVEAAKSPFGIEDRKELFKHSGFTPTAKGTSINVQANANSHSASQSASVSQGASVSQLPTFETGIRRASEIVKGDASVRRISAPAKEIESGAILDAEIVEESND